MKSSKTFNATFNENDTISFMWSEIMSEALNYQYVVMYRDHAPGNSKGEYFLATDFAQLFEQQGFWFSDTERPVMKVILTDDDVPAIIAERRELISQLERIECDMLRVNVPGRPNCDGRATRRTQPEAFAAWDKAKAETKRQLDALVAKRAALREALADVQPSYSSSLYRINK